MKKLKLLPLVLLLIIIVLFSGCEKKTETADLIVYGDIYTSNESARHIEAFAVKDNKYIAVGTKEEVNKYKGNNTKVIEAEFAMSGGIEAHGHFITDQALKFGLYIDHYNSDGSVKTKDQILDEAVAYRNAHPDLTKIYGFGYSGSLFDISSADIDAREELRDIPVYISEATLHGGWCNSKCLEAADIRKGNIPENINTIILDDEGNPTGVVKDEACTYVRNKVFGALNDVEGYGKAIYNSSKFLNSMGYIAHYDMWTNFDGTETLYQALKEYGDSKDATCLYAGAYCFESFELNENNLNEKIKEAAAVKDKYEAHNFKPMFVKLFKDGVIESKTGYISNPYYGDESYGHGNNFWDEDLMNKIVLEANKNDLLVHVHTYGDKAITETINSFIYANENSKYHRNSLAHVAYINETDYQRIADNQIGCAIAGNWGTPISPEMNAVYDILLCKEGAYKNMYPAEQFPDYGIKAAISTDYPCGTLTGISLFDYIGILVTGKDYATGNGDAYPAARDEHCTLEEALDMSTINGAWMACLENERGSIEVGKYADFIVTDKSPFDIDLKDIHSIEITNLFFEGKEVNIKG